MKPLAVIIADDHAVLRAGLRLLIDGEADLKVAAEAADGPEALRKARTLKPDVVVLDLTMPRTDPLATIRELVRVPTRVVVLTMHDDPAYVEAALSAGADGYVAKLAADLELLAAIRAVSRGRQFVDARSARARPRRATAGARRPLSHRETQVVRLVGHGLTNREIAERLGIGTKSVETFRARACEKVGLRSRADLMRFVLDMGWVRPDASELDSRSGGGGRDASRSARRPRPRRAARRAPRRSL
jgi:two-component system, NarL family, response regulator NreC